MYRQSPGHLQGEGESSTAVLHGATAASRGIVVLQQLEYAEHGHKVLFWYLGDWKKVEKALEKLSSLLPFLRKADGSLLSTEECESIRRDARLIFFGIIERAINPPVSWFNHATIEQRQEFRYEMESRHEELRYCQGGWKSEAVAKLVYPQVKYTYSRRAQRAIERGLQVAEELSPWLRSSSKNTRKDEGTIDPTSDSWKSAQKRKQPPKTVLSEESHRPKQRAALKIVNVM